MAVLRDRISDRNLCLSYSKDWTEPGSRLKYACCGTSSRSRARRANTFIFSVSLFAGDRAEAAPQIRAWLAAGKAVILDRYVYSNVGYQCAKLPAGAARERLARWILDLEFGRNALPRPDRTLFLDVPFAFTERRLTEQRAGDDRAYLQGGQDIHEGSLDLQRTVREVYLDAAAHDPELHVVDCRAADGGMDTPEGIFAKIRSELNPLFECR